MTEDNVWFIIDKMNWSSDHDAERCYEVFINLLKEKGWSKESYEEQFFKLSDNLFKTLEKHNFSLDPDGGYGLGDDGFAYLCDSIMGSGKELYYKVLKDNSIALKMAEDYDFEEGFCWHMDPS